MFKTFLEKNSLSQYRFRSDIYPTIRDRTFWDAFRNEDYIGIAEKALDYGWPVIKATDFMEFKKSGNRIIMENIHFGRRKHLALFALAELKENKGRFLPQIVNGLFAICEETFWGLSAHWPHRSYELGNIHRPDEPYIDLFVAETAEHLAMIAELLREPLTEYCPEILDRIEYELERRIKAPYLLNRGWGWLGYHKRPNNWNPWILSNLLTIFLLTEKNERRLRRALEKMLTEIQFYYDSLPEDGGCDEGPHYWGQAGASLFEFVYQLKTATDGQLDLFGDEKLGKIASYMKKVHLVSDYFVNVADAHPTGLASAMPLLFAFARETGQKELMNFSAAVYRDRSSSPDVLSRTNQTLRRLIYHARFLREMQDYPVSYPIHGALEHLPNMELAVLRKGDLILSAKGGFNDESHNHNDVGSIIFYDGATPVLIDVGINTYTRFTFQNKTRYTMIPWTRSLYHNLPRVNGTEQPYGKKFRADRFRADEEKISISFGGAYPSEAGLSALTRELTLNETGMTCTDRFCFIEDGKRQVTEVLMSILPVRIETDAAVLGDRYLLRADCSEIIAEFVPFEDERLESDWNAKGVTRILISAKPQEQITFTIEKIRKDEE